MGRIIGIDLGTTNSVVAVVEGGEPKVLVNEEGAYTTPSVVAYTKEGGRLVGQIAKRQAVTNPENTIYSAKRFIGKKYQEVKDEISLTPFNVVEQKDGSCAFEVRGKKITPEEVSAAILAKLKKVAEDYLGESVKEAVITVPAYFNDAQRQSTKDAGRIAGLDVKRVVNEPTAAALSYGLDKKKDQKIAIFDLGGGTFDISILEVGDGVIDVLATSGDTHLGGDNFDEHILSWMADGFKSDQGIDLTKDKMALQRLKEAAEKAKVELSSAKETEINLPFITADSSGPKHFNIKLSRVQFERMTEDLVNRCLEICKKVVEDAKLKVSDVNEVILVGGSTRIPKVQEEMGKFFGESEGRKLNKSVNPDEVVAMGAAVQGGVLSGDVKDVVLLDVIPLALGIETLGGITTRIVERNTTIPVKKSQNFSTAQDNQREVKVHVLEGEREMAVDNRTLGRFDLVDIPSAPRGVPQIEVTFDVDTNGILNVSAKDLGSGKEQNIKISAKSGLSEEEIQKLIKDAEKCSEEDHAKKELVNKKNDLDSLIYQSSKVLKEHEKTLPEEKKNSVMGILKEAQEALASEDRTKIEAAIDKLRTINQELGAKLYEQAGQQQQANSQSDTKSSSSQEAQDGKSKEEDVIDADYKEATDNKT